jgi:hypothetical protein
MTTAVCGILLVACGGSDSPVDAQGQYAISLTSRTNDCGFDNWTEGESSTGIPLTITQDGAEADAEVGGLAAAFLDLALGEHIFSGTVSGRHLDLEIFGSRQLTRAGCPHVVNATLEASLEGDVLQGEIHYTVNGNGSPECEALDGCDSYQEFNGTRPPQ